MTGLEDRHGPTRTYTDRHGQARTGNQIPDRLCRPCGPWTSVSVREGAPYPPPVPAVSVPFGPCTSFPRSRFGGAGVVPPFPRSTV